MEISVKELQELLIAERNASDGGYYAQLKNSHDELLNNKKNLEKENQELKDEVDYWKDQFNQMETHYKRANSEGVKSFDENRELKAKIETLEKENQELKTIEDNAKKDSSEENETIENKKRNLKDKYYLLKQKKVFFYIVTSITKT